MPGALGSSAFVVPRLGTLGRLGRWPVRAKSMAAAKGEGALVTDWDLWYMPQAGSSCACSHHIAVVILGMISPNSYCDLWR